MQDVPRRRLLAEIVRADALDQHVVRALNKTRKPKKEVLTLYLPEGAVQKTGPGQSRHARKRSERDF